MISYKCQHCGAELESPDSLGGKNDTCGACGKETSVPKPESKTLRRRTKKYFAVAGMGLLCLVAGMWIGNSFAASHVEPEKIYVEVPVESKESTEARKLKIYSSENYRVAIKYLWQQYISDKQNLRELQNLRGPNASRIEIHHIPFIEFNDDGTLLLCQPFEFISVRGKTSVIYAKWTCSKSDGLGKWQAVTLGAKELENGNMAKQVRQGYLSIP